MSFTEVADGRVTVRVDPDLYPLEALHQAAYVLLDRAYVLLDLLPGTDDTPGAYVAVLEPKDDADPPADLGGAFANELLNQAYRGAVADERRTEWSERRRDTHALERLEERKKEEHRAELQRADDAVLDEWAGSAHARKKR